MRRERGSHCNDAESDFRVEIVAAQRVACASADETRRKAHPLKALLGVRVFANVPKVRAGTQEHGRISLHRKVGVHNQGGEY